jgi:hypothetical protein
MTASRVPVQVQGLAGAAWGVAVVAAGQRVWSACTRRPPTPIERSAIVVLGCRQVVQGLAQVCAPLRLRRTWLLVDLAHAGSMVLLAWQDEQRRRPALLSAAVATASAAASLRSLDNSG